MELDVWQQAIDLVAETYQATRRLPPEERYELRQQMRRAAISVASNVAEGEGRRAWRDHAHFYLQARGSLLELETQVVVCRRLAYFESEVENALLGRSSKVGQLINGTLRYLKRKADSGKRKA